MNLKELKKSMLFRACEYAKEPMTMEKFIEVNNTSMISPESDLIRFYLGAHILGVVETKYGIEAELPEEVAALVEDHHGQMEEVFFRMFTYIMLISMGESRHGSTGGMKEEISKLFGLDVTNYTTIISKSSGRSGARTEFLNSNRDVLNFMEYCDWVFIKAFTSGSSYGGPKWKVISNKVTQVLSGEISPFTMVDVAWALVHNTGSIFNKNTIYKSEYSTDGLTQMLDMQRGGAIPSLIINFDMYAQTSGWGINKNFLLGFTPIVTNASEVLGEDLAQFVPLHEVAKAGALSHIIQLQKMDTDEVAESLPTEDAVSFTGELFNIGIHEIPVMKRGEA
jgi:hypothetical protein